MTDFKAHEIRRRMRLETPSYVYYHASYAEKYLSLLTKHYKKCLKKHVLRSKLQNCARFGNALVQVTKKVVIAKFKARKISLRA